MKQIPFTAVIAALAVLGMGSAPAEQRLGEEHELDELSRELAAGETVDCEGMELVDYAGTHVAYNRPGQVHPEFAERLERFERVLVDVALDVYGRAPDELDQHSLFRCRQSTSGSGRVSEHAFGNAIDVAAFHFPELPEGAKAPPELPDELRSSFSIDVGTHFHPQTSSAVDLRHALFFRRLMAELEARDDIFRGMIGPPAADHETVLHFDAGPWRYERYELPPG